MPALLSQSQKMMASGALILSVLAIFVAVATQATPCANAAAGSCSVGDIETFTSAITVNTDLNDADTIISGDTNANLWYVNAGIDRVGINTDAPNGLFDVAGNTLISTENFAWVGPDSAATGFSDSHLTVGTIVNQEANDNSVLLIKSSDVAHGMTGIQETDTFGSYTKAASTSGGLFVTALKDSDGNPDNAMIIQAILGEAADTTTTTSSGAIIQMRAEVKSGTSSTSVAAAGNALSITNQGTILELWKGNGDSWQSGVSGYESGSDPATIADTAHVYAKDVTASSEIFVRDEAGNVTQISPHQGDSWFFESCNDFTGKCISIDMENALLALEVITGQNLITITHSQPKLVWESEQNRLVAASEAAIALWEASDPADRSGESPVAYNAEPKPQWLVDRLNEIASN